MSETESSQDTNFWADDDGAGASTEGWSSTTSMGMNWGAAWEMAGALGAEMGHSTSKEVSKAVETTIALPPHTAAAINHATTTTTYTQYYQQPVILSYKVALFATSGDFTTAAGGGINPGQYDKQSLVIKFDTKDESDSSYGCAATDDLYSRVVTNKSVSDYDSAGGRTFESHSTASGFSKSNGIDWDAVDGYTSSNYGINVSYIAKTNYFYETLGKLSVDQDKNSSSVDAIYPLYDLVSVKTSKTNYVLYSNNTLDRNSFAVAGYNKYGVDFYGFNPEWGEWNRCDEDGNLINGGFLTDDDPVELKDGDTLVPKANTTGGTIYMTWVLNPEIKPKTGDHLDGQDLTDPAIETPVVRIDVVNRGLDDPRVAAEGSYTGFYRTPINLHDVMTYEVTDADDRILEVQVNWESREPASYGIKVNASGDVTFTKPGTYKVRPYVVNNQNTVVYSSWLTVVATEHDLMHYDPKDPACDANGWTEHYRCLDCGKYFADAAGTTEVSAEDVFIDAVGHDWGDWTTTKQASASEPGEQQRVCKHDEGHVEKRNLYLVQYNMNGHGTAPDAQPVAAGTSVTAPQDPTVTGYTFDGWFTDSECTTPYNFGSTVDGNLTLYAKWTVTKRTVAAMAVGDVYEDEEGELKIEPVANGSITIEGEEGEVIPVTEDDYTYFYKDVEYGASVTLTVEPDSGYGLKGIMAIPVNPDSSMGEPFTPDKTGANTYSFTMPDADVAIVASFAQVTVTYDGNAPEGEKALNVPEAETIAYGSTPTKLDTVPTIESTTSATYEFGGWFTDDACTKPFLSSTAITEDTTLYAKWIKTEAPTHKVTYTLTWEPDPADPEDTGSYEESYQAEPGSVAYDPTEDLYDVAGKDLRAAYELYSLNDACWFTDPALTEPFDFTTPIEADIHLYAKVVAREYTVTYYSDNTELGTQRVAYNTAIGTIDPGISVPEKAGFTFTDEWVTEDGAPWSIADNPVTSDLKLYASWRVNRYSVTFDANGGAGTIGAEEVEEGTEYALPGSDALTAPEGMCSLEAWEVKVGLGDPVNVAPGESVTVTANTMVKALWQDHAWDAPTYEWADDNSTVTATRVCTHDPEHAETETVGATSEQTKQPTCAEKGETTYTSALFENEAFEQQVKTEADIDVIDHEWGEPTYTWADDNSTVTATRTCAVCEEVETETVDATAAMTTKPSDTKPGVLTWTSAEFTNPDFKVQTKEQEVPALGKLEVEHVGQPLWVAGESADIVARVTNLDVDDGETIVSWAWEYTKTPEKAESWKKTGAKNYADGDSCTLYIPECTEARKPNMAWRATATTNFGRTATTEGQSLEVLQELKVVAADTYKWVADADVELKAIAKGLSTGETIQSVQWYYSKDQTTWKKTGAKWEITDNATATTLSGFTATEARKAPMAWNVRVTTSSGRTATSESISLVS
ncbi:MAG: InlB B-repeat-containing protein [Eggerthellaceae bacterium]|nr:InlB B-repeat-containing protein [Eggerthellaceae bacterium]